LGRKRPTGGNSERKKLCRPYRIGQEQTEETEKSEGKSLLSLFPPVKVRAMHPLHQKAAGLTETIIAAANEVHRDKGPGLIESIYEWCMPKELGLRGLGCISQKWW
jgi:hypothetical protein